MKASLLAVLACPECQNPLAFTGETSKWRLVNGVLECPKNHRFQVKHEIAMLKEPRLSSGEFVWKVKFPDVQRYDRIRSRYRSYLSVDQVKADELLLGEIVRKAPRKGVILDIATGMGTLLMAIGKDRRGTQVLGTDVDETPLRGAMLKLKEQDSFGGVSLCVMDGKHLAVKSKRISCVVSHFGFNNIPQTSKALLEASRVLGPKGKLIFSAISMEENSGSFRLANELGYGEISTEANLVANLEQAGFRIDSVKKFYSGEWPHNPMDRLPLEGDWFAHLLVQAHAR